MKPFFYLLFLFNIISSNYAQDSCTVENPHGLQFQISQDFQLVNFSGYMFSYRYLLNKTSGLRFGFSIGFNNNETTKDDLEEYETTNEFDDNRDYNNFNLDLSVQYHYNVVMEKNVNFFIGIGPYFSTTNTEEKTNVNNYSQTVAQTHSNTKINNYYYGISGLLGVEYMFTSDFSLSVEAGLVIQYFTNNYDFYSYTKYETNSILFETTTSRNTNGIGINETPVRMGLTLFF